MQNRIKITEDEMTLINKFSRSPLSPDDIYVFPVVLCDNEIDRDNERFSVKALYELADMFIGKSGIFDHSMSGKDQKARIFFTEVQKDESRMTKAGEVYHKLYAKAYMPRTQENESLICEIDAGIKKEVSVGCSVSASKCSVCLKNVGECSHIPGKVYDGKVCYKILDGAKDAYEWSFVAVPAQPGAGVVKSFQYRKDSVCSLTSLITKMENASGEIKLTKKDASKLCDYIKQLKDDAALGEKYKQMLTDEVIALCPAAMPEIEIETFKGVAKVMTEKELLEFKKAFETKISKILPPAPQLTAKKEEKFDLGEFKI